MKKHIFTAICALALGASAGMAQNQAKVELQGEINEGIAKFTSEDGKYSFRVGARVDVDGEYNFDNYDNGVDRQSGARITAARIRVLSKLGDKFDMKLDVDFMAKNFLKDAWLRWHTTDNSFLRLGNFAEPFSAENIQSTMDYPFITKSATTQSLGTGRAIGLSYRYYMPYFWGEAGVFSQKLQQDYTAGDMGWSFSTRLLGRYTSEDFNIHVGGSFNYRRPNAKGFSDGSDDYGRVVALSSNLEHAVDETQFLTATVKNANNWYRWGAELMMNYKMVYLKAEYVGSKVTRKTDWEASFNKYIGTLLGTYFPNSDGFAKLLGGDNDYDTYGCNAQVGVLLLGGDYKYNSVEAMMRRPKGKSLELVARYNHTNLNDYWGFYNMQYGKYAGFYDSAFLASYFIGNQSIAGGRVNSYTLGLNYYVTDYIVCRLDYQYSHLSNWYNPEFRNANNLHSIAARVAFEF